MARDGTARDSTAHHRMAQDSTAHSLRTLGSCLTTSGDTTSSQEPGASGATRCLPMVPARGVSSPSEEGAGSPRHLCAPHRAQGRQGDHSTFDSFLWLLLNLPLSIKVH